MIHIGLVSNTISRAEALKRFLQHSDVLSVAQICGFDSAMWDAVKFTQVALIAIDASVDEDGALRYAAESMRRNSVPVVLLTDTDRLSSLRQRIDQLGTAVLAVLQYQDGDAGDRDVLIRQLLLYSEVKVIRRWDSNKFEVLSKAIASEFQLDAQELFIPGRKTVESIPAVVVIGASAGGTKALEQIVGRLPADFPLPLMIVQHLAPGYVTGFAQWLDQRTKLRVRVAERDAPIVAGQVFLAPDDRHLSISAEHRITLTMDEPLHGFRPSIGRLFSAAHAAWGSQVVAILLSGMGVDGAVEMRALYEAGAMTIAQDKETSLIHGIPGEAIKIGAVRLILPVQQIAPALCSISRRTRIVAVTRA
jgi:two-component system, chemotaxis family, protein-glutamate methylesterase/glutaminase